jgi:uncharacterized protein (TIGR02594 family)
MNSIQRIQTILGVDADGVWGPKSAAALAALVSSNPKPNSPDVPWLVVAKNELGTKEIPGDRDNPRILEYHRATSLAASDDETPWCAAFVNWVFKQVNIPGTNSAMARSFLQWGRAIMNPVPGCVVVFARGAYPSGHVAFFLSRSGGFVTVLGGNQSNQVKISEYPASDVLGYRMPA